MDAKTCLEKMKLAGTLAMATVDASGAPQVRCVSAVHYEPYAVCFFTARGKEMTRQLMADGRIQTMVHTRFNEMIRMSGVARPVAEGEQRAWIDRIFEEQPHLGNVYPGDTREIGIVFEVRDIALDYFNLGVKPIERATFSLGEASAPLKGYCITDSCIGCGTCLRSCPQKCIVPGDTYRIEASHCLHCGACAQVCPVGAVERL